ncbi:class I SAM-dependent methyltransferase [Acidovorax sp. sic0104]|uniref:class I SAM-dependent methyltransferase n=2 Tax=Acidovorax sp. sic0104 TaxID=2854784 RepID=UPI0030DCB81B|nr:class I SAM-dependent methyltransferase [Acidovorax sp. sic0104]
MSGASAYLHNMRARNYLLKTVKRFIRYTHAWSRYAPGVCNMCGREVPSFLPYRIGTASISPILRELDIIGSDLGRFSCPFCGCTDRERHLLAFMQRSNLLELRGKQVLHFAPERNLRKYIQSVQPTAYIQGDLFPGEPEITRVDITAIQFPDAQFDLLIANHVLEHVPNDIAAIKEIVRVLKPGGHAILQTPFAAKLEHSLSLPQIRSSETRLLLYGQEDHVRLYGSDIFGLVTSAGLIPKIQFHGDLLPDMDAHRYGMNLREPFMCWVKP